MALQLTQLSEAQRAAMPVHAKAWIDRALAVRPANREIGERGIRAYYRLAGLPEPKRIVWTTSPLVVALAGPIAALILSMRAKRASTVRDAVHDAVDGREEVQAWLRAIQQLWFYILGGAGWAAWPAAWATYYRDVCELSLAPEATSAAEDATEQWWWWSHREFVIVSERPVRLERDDRGRLHSTTGAAIQFSDGWGLYYVHGVRVPGHVVLHPERMTAALITEERNAEVRRVMVELFGFDRYLVESGAKVLHRDTDPLGFARELLRIEQPGDEPIVAVAVTNSTPEPDGTRKRYTLRVHPELRPLLGQRNGEPQYGNAQAATAQNAIASTFGLYGEQYAPQAET